MNLSDVSRNAYMLRGSLAKKGYMRWWHSFRGTCAENGLIRTFFVEYFLLNPGILNNKIVLEGNSASFCMIKAGAFPDQDNEGVQMNAFYPITALRMTKEPFYVKMGESSFSETHLSGSVWISDRKAMDSSRITDSGSMEWDLSLRKTIAFHTGAISGPFFTALNALDSFWHGEGIKTQYQGTVVINGETYEISPETCNGYADKHWGRKYQQPWLQFATNRLFSEKTGKELKYSAFAADGCYTRFLGLQLKPKLLLQLTYTGEDFEFSFARPFSFSRVKWNKKKTNKRIIWQMKACNKKSMIKCSISCPRRSLFSILYKSPDLQQGNTSLMTSGQTVGVIELYRKTPEGYLKLDTLHFEEGICMYKGGRFI